MDTVSATEPRDATQERSAWRELRLLAPLSRRHAWAAPVVLLLGFAAALAESVGVSLVVLFLYLLLGRGAEAIGVGGLLGRIFEAADALVGGSSIALGLLIFGLIMGKAALGLAYALVIARARNSISEDARNLVHAQCLDIAYSDLSRRDRGALLNTLATESWRLAEAWHAATRIAINLCTIAVFGALLVAVSWQITLLAAAGSLLLFLAQRALSARAAALGQAAVQSNQRLAARMLAALQGMRTIRAFGAEAAEKARFRRTSAEARVNFNRVERLYALIGPLGEIGALALLGTIVVVSVLVGLPAATTLAAVALLHRVNPHLREIEGQRAGLAGMAASLRALREIVDRTGKAYPPDGPLPFRGIGEAIRLERVSFTHPGASRPSLAEASLTLPRGALTVIVGPSGSGKTTIVNLLLRLHEPNSGAILVDGRQLASLRRQDWLARIALAGQDSELIQGSIAENIRMARPEAGLVELRDAAEAAGILDVIEALPQGFDTQVGEQGLNLSGGQRQRIGLARALVREPELLILDEATNAVDMKLEEDIRARLRARLPHATILVITHRLSSALASDHVVCLSEGRVVEEGAPQHLATLRGGVFRGLLDHAA